MMRGSRMAKRLRLESLLERRKIDRWNEIIEQVSIWFVCQRSVSDMGLTRRNKDNHSVECPQSQYCQRSQWSNMSLGKKRSRNHSAAACDEHRRVRATIQWRQRLDGYRVGWIRLGRIPLYPSLESRGCYERHNFLQSVRVRTRKTCLGKIVAYHKGRVSRIWYGFDCIGHRFSSWRRTLWGHLPYVA